MDYERGIFKLKNHLRQYGHERSLAQLHEIEMQLWEHNDSNCPNTHNMLQKLDVLAKRSLSLSFEELCRKPSYKYNIFPLSLRNVLILVILFVLFPVISLATYSVRAGREIRNARDEIENEVQMIDERINKEEGISAPYYLTNFIGKKCEDVLDPISQDGNLTIKATSPSKKLRDIEIENNSNYYVWCILKYYDGESEIELARDYFGWENRELAEREKWALKEREYYNDTLIARDYFDLGDIGCVKVRQIIGSPEENQCFAKNGEIKSFAVIDFTSPLPPMVYWFFYR